MYGNNYNDHYNIYRLNECINNNHLFCTGTPATKYVCFLIKYWFTALDLADTLLDII